MKFQSKQQDVHIVLQFLKKNKYDMNKSQDEGKAFWFFCVAKHMTCFDWYLWRIFIIGEGNYTGTIKKGFQINRADISKKETKLSYSSCIYTGKDNYKGSIKKTFKINPKEISISELKASKRGFTVKWKKRTVQTTGYQIQYSTSSEFENKKTVNDVKYYSKWSVKKSIKTK